MAPKSVYGKKSVCFSSSCFGFAFAPDAVLSHVAAIQQHSTTNLCKAAHKLFGAIKIKTVGRAFVPLKTVLREGGEGMRQKIWERFVGVPPTASSSLSFAAFDVFLRRDTGIVVRNRHSSPLNLL
jgi:hypothetical protein